MGKMSSEEKRWRAIDDAYTLMRSEEIKSDKSRLKSAKAEAKNIVKEKEKEVKKMKKVTGGVNKKVQVKKKPVVKKKSVAKRRIKK